MEPDTLVGAAMLFWLGIVSHCAHEDPLESWFRFAISNKRSRRKRKREATSIGLSFVLAIVFGVVPLPTAWKWSGWAFCWVLLLSIVSGSDPIGRTPIKTRISGFVFFVLLFPVVFTNFALKQWRSEKSSARTGVLHAAKPGWRKGHPPNTTNDIEIGQSRVELSVDLPPGQEHTDFWRLYHYAKLKIEKGDTELEFTTTVRDREGAVIAIIENNKWTVYPPCLDKNYTDDSLEVRDKRGHIVLQVRVLSDRIQLQGEWNDEYGEGMRMIQSPDKQHPGAHLIRWDNPQEAERKDNDATEIKPWFKYPSAEHWAEWE